MTQTEIMAKGVLWALAIGFGLWGLGETVRKNTDPTLPEWTNPLWGCTLFILIGGWMDLSATATRTNLTLLLLVGIGAGMLTLTKKGKAWAAMSKKTPCPKQTATIAWLTACALGLAWVGSRTILYRGNWDDITGYLPLCNQIAAHGTSWEPLSMRRATSWGGQFPLQTLGMLFTYDRGGYIYERGVGTLLLLGLATAAAKEVKGWTGVVVGTLILLAPQGNTSCAASVTVTALCLATWLARKKPALMAACSCAAIALRFQAIPFVGAVALTEAWEERKNILRWAGTYSASFAACALPFAWSEMLQFHTPITALWHGTLDPALTTFQSNWKMQLGNWVVVAASMGPAIIAIGAGLKNKETRGACAGGLLTLAYMVCCMPEYSLYEWRRYAWPALAGAAIISAWQWGSKNKTAAALTLAALPPTQ